MGTSYPTNFLRSDNVFVDPISNNLVPANPAYPYSSVFNPLFAALGVGSPAYFSAYPSVNKPLANTTLTKVQLDTKNFDSNGWFDNVTNFRFTPQLAGKYRIHGQIGLQATTGAGTFAYIFKSGADYVASAGGASYSGFEWISVDAIISFNGTTDYVEFFTQINGSGGSLSYVGGVAPQQTYFEGQYIGP